MEEAGLVVRLAGIVGCPEPALRLLISLLLGYPIAFIYRKYFFGKPSNWQHLYFIVCGMSLCYFNYGLDLIHSFASIGITYLILKIFGGTLFSLLSVFIYTMVHLLVGYWTTATSTYDIKWTMPQCVLTLRLIGLAFNVYDGRQKFEKLSEENKKVALPTMPSLLEVYAHGYFPSSFAVGPQFPLKRYKDFVELKLQPTANSRELPKSVIPGLRRFAFGLFYLIIYQLVSPYVYDDYFTTAEYRGLPLWKQFFFLGLWSRITLYKYISCWLITEGSCIIMGLTYDGVDEKGNPKWDGCSNVNLKVFENCTKMNHYIESFNTNTNQWVAQYIYKRLKFLNNKTASYAGALVFLAVWHGFHSGYYTTFFFEYLIISSEKEVISIIDRHQQFVRIVTSSYVYPIVQVFLRIYTFVVMGYAMIPFILLKYQKYMPLFQHFYFFLHIICISILALSPFLKAKTRSSSESSTTRRINVKVKGKNT